MKKIKASTIVALIMLFVSFSFIAYTANDVVKKDTGVKIVNTVPVAKDSVVTDQKTTEAAADPSIWSYLLGNYTTNQFIAMFIFAFLGMCFTLLILTTGRDPNSPNSPTKFNWGYLIKDNWKRIVLSLIVIYVSFLFATNLFGIEITDSNCTWIAFCIGVGIDGIIGIIKTKANIFKGKTATPVDNPPVANTPSVAPPPDQPTQP